VRVAFVHVPRYPCAVEITRQPRLAQGPLIVGDSEKPKRVLDCCAEAQRWGVLRGMTIRKALAACSQAVLIPPDPVLYGGLWESTIASFFEVSPEVEDEGWGRAYVNVAGLQSHYRSEEDLGRSIAEAVRTVSGLDASVGFASGKLIALAAADSAPAGGVCIVPANSEAAFLADADVALLPVDPEIVFRLQLLGLYTLGDVARLTVPELQSQFGLAGKRVWELANGIDVTPLVPMPRMETLAAGFTFESPVAGIDVMLAVAKQLLSRLQPSLRGRAVRELILQAELSTERGWERRMVLREAVSEEPRLLFVLRSLLNNFPPPQAISSLTLRLEGLTGESGKQLSLGDHSRLQRQLEETIEQLKARYGYSPVYRCVDVEPWSVIPEERQILVESDG
jgi:nucleotidyltransferase/DNA polymerase involved in DNA repair